MGRFIPARPSKKGCMKKLLIALLGLAPIVLWAASGTISNTVSSTRSMQKATVYWTSTASGGADGDLTIPVNGEIYRIDISSASTAPIGLYDMTLTDDAGIDVLRGVGGNCNPTGVVHVDSDTNGYPLAVDDTALTFAVTNAGATKSAKIELYFR